MELRLGLVGCGAISQKHLAAIYGNNPTYGLTAVCDVDSVRAHGTAESYSTETDRPKPQVFSSVERMLADLPLDVVAISTPSAYHADAIVQSLESGAHVIAEKPLALMTADLDRIEEAAKVAKKKVTACYVTRFAPHIRRLAVELEHGRLGDIYHVGLSIYWNRNEDYYKQAPWRGTWELDGGALMNQCTHGIDLLQWIAGGKPKSVQAELRRFERPIEAEDFGTALISFQNGAVATFTGTVVTYPTNLGTQLTVVGSKGTVQLGGNGLNRVTAWRINGDDDGVEERIMAGDYGVIQGKAGHAGVYEDLADAIKNDSDPKVTLADARRSVDVVLGIYQSAKVGAQVTFPVSFGTNQMSKGDVD